MSVYRSFVSASSSLSSAESCLRFGYYSTFPAVIRRRRIFAGTAGGRRLPVAAHLENDFASTSLTANRTFSTAASPSEKSGSPISGSLFNLMRYYEDISGWTEVREAQNKVLLAERDFEKMQEVRRSKQEDLRRVQLQLTEVHAELDKTSRGEDRYLDYLRQEHDLIKEEKILSDEFKRVERAERDCFNLLSTRLRESHEKERERAERTKYWSIIGSVVGALIGIFGTTINNRLRIRELRDVVDQNSDTGRIRTIIGSLSDTVHNQQQHVASFINDLKAMLSSSNTQWNSALENVAHQGNVQSSPQFDQWLSADQSEEIMKTIRHQEKNIEHNMQEIKKMVAAQHGYSMKHDGMMVYVGQEMQALLDETERNIDTKLKINTLVAVVAFYSALALTLPLLYAIFKGLSFWNLQARPRHLGRKPGAVAILVPRPEGKQVQETLLQNEFVKTYITAKYASSI